jgi:endonuclease/exonuclease/phosphatase family metal-dependent hydrolase
MPSIRVLTYNVRSLRDDRAALVRVVRACAPDVLVVQEAPRLLRWRSRCAALAQDTGLFYVAGGRTAGGNLLLAGARVGVHGVVERRIPQRRRDPIRGVVAATLGVDAQRFGVVGIHLSLSAAGRARDVDVVLDTVRGLGTLPVVVAGDLNETPGGRSWAALTGAGLDDAGADEARPTFPARGPRSRIDAILVSGEGVKVRDYRVPDEAELRTDVGRATDHLPLLAVLELGD